MSRVDSWLGSANIATVTASTKRNPAPSGGKISAATTYLSSLTVTPLESVNGEIVNILQLDSAREYKQCFYFPAFGGSLPDVKEGDTLTISGTDYPVLYAAEYTTPNANGLQIVCQQVKQG